MGVKSYPRNSITAFQLSMPRQAHLTYAFIGSAAKSCGFVTDVTLKSTPIAFLQNVKEPNQFWFVRIEMYDPDLNEPYSPELIVGRRYKAFPRIESNPNKWAFIGTYQRRHPLGFDIFSDVIYYNGGHSTTDQFSRQSYTFFEQTAGGRRKTRHSKRGTRRSKRSTRRSKRGSTRRSHRRRF